MAAPSMRRPVLPLVMELQRIARASADADRYALEEASGALLRMERELRELQDELAARAREPSS